MFKVELITVVGSFIATTPDKIKTELDALDAIGDAITEPGGAIPLDDGSLLRVIGCKPIMLRAYSDTDDKPGEMKPEQFQEDPLTAKKPGIVHVHRERIIYLGQTCSIVMLLAWDSKSRAYFMPYRIENIPAAQYLNPKNFKGIVDAWLEQTYGGYTGEYEVIIPHGVVDTLEEAQEYVRDYIKESAPEHKPAEKTGKAWQGFAEDRGRTE